MFMFIHVVVYFRIRKVGNLGSPPPPECKNSADTPVSQLRRFAPCSGDGLTIMRANEVAFLRLTDRFGGLGCFLFNIGMFHFYWFCMIIIFNIMWLWGFADLVKLLNKASRVSKEAKKFNDSDQFYFLVYDSFILYALEEYSAQRVQLGLPDSWAGFQSFLHHRKGKTDQVRTQWVEFFCSYGWWYVALRMAVRRGDGALQFLLIKAFLPLFV